MLCHGPQLPKNSSVGLDCRASCFCCRLGRTSPCFQPQWSPGGAVANRFWGGSLSPKPSNRKAGVGQFGDGWGPGKLNPEPMCRRTVVAREFLPPPTDTQLEDGPPFRPRASRFQAPVLPNKMTAQKSTTQHQTPTSPGPFA